MKIIHIISSLKRGGRERQLVTLYRYSDSGKVATKIICLNRTEPSYVKEYSLDKDLVYLENNSFIGRINEVVRFIRAERPDVIWTWGGLEATMGIILSFITGVRHINGSVRHGIVRMKADHIWRLVILHLSRHIVANSYAGLKANYLKRGHVLYNGLDDSFFKNHEEGLQVLRNQIPGYRKTDIVFISVANLVPYKDYITVIRALDMIKPDLPRFKYLVVGEGPERNRIMEEITARDLSDRIILLGQKQNIGEWLACADIFIHSSRGEGCSNAILEAMAAGLPVIATDTGGTKEILSPEAGFLFEFGNANRLASAIKNLLSDNRKITEMKKASRDHALSHFGARQMIGKYYAIIETITR
ncbi:MAG: glycosyltransferase [Bacteroidales bacterium]|nr:glycosyltransferase [Bacteroidales bacterium]